MPVNVSVDIPFDWVGSVIVPALAILVSSGIAVWVVGVERRRAERAAVRTEAAELIRTLDALGRAVELGEADERRQATASFEKQLSAFAAHLSRRDAVVAKFVGVVHSSARKGPRELVPRATLWLIASIELWMRGQLKAENFAENMPVDTSAWTEAVDLSDHRAILEGRRVDGFPHTKLALSHGYRDDA